MRLLARDLHRQMHGTQLVKLQNLIFVDVAFPLFYYYKEKILEPLKVTSLYPMNFNEQSAYCFFQKPRLQLTEQFAANISLPFLFSLLTELLLLFYGLCI